MEIFVLLQSDVRYVVIEIGALALIQERGVWPGPLICYFGRSLNVEVVHSMLSGSE